ncbi:hypothetical protein G7B40_022275 [Aetokthonos hydrillicola Thurmond2011]|jgi:lysophospholipase L1-like esterase|uniref:Uncharacterized protein n=1 Tax=Aetokthonos hydrillicola Thurmond2011 TaxID=2712845 RepID=A0AAP5IE48_9CYAN|nr:hypothetical protein [Aetokthonos hydrillicola]MBO3460788.1 hypothetical protein [Aetokthonos hydrillicola CCALA 1050]MBW4585385.1 hypothetical protein [Aetokthonos hydrillicola CCALA 1050]MDR9897270.1 hypothetical protein [Aetokthonos hydrillicola Thurmond2011]
MTNKTLHNPPKQEYLQFLMSKEEKAKLKEIAASKGVSAAEALRQLINAYEIPLSDKLKYKSRLSECYVSLDEEDQLLLG